MLTYTRISPPEIIALSAAIAVFLSDGLNAGEQAFLGNLLMTIGQNVTTIAAQTQAVEDDAEKLNAEKTEKNNKTGVDESGKIKL